MNETEQIDENVRVASKKTPLSELQRTAMTKRLAAAKKDLDAFCTSCGYCGPCPSGVDIPASFRLLHSATYFGLTEYAKRQYKWLINHDKSGHSCVQCGQCLPKCPNDVPIIDRLAEAARLLS